MLAFRRLLILLVFSLVLTGCRDDETQPAGMAPATEPYYAETIINTRLLSSFNKYASAGYSNLWGYTDAALREYALLGARTGTSIVEITDGENPVERAFIAGPNSHWRELKTYRHYAYVVTEAGGGIQIIDLSNLPTSAALAHTYTGINRAHTITIDTARGILYTSGGEAISAHAFDLSDPLNPIEIGVFNAPKYVHDLSVQGLFAYLAEGSAGSYSIFDMTDPAAPVRISHIHAPGTGHAAEFRGHINDEGHGSDGAGSYAHNIAPTTDGLAVLTTEETQGKTVKRWDMSDPALPRVTAEYLGPNGLAHNVHVKGGYAYVAHYSAGLRVLDLADPNALSEVAAYTRAGTRPAGFSGVWGLYPYFDSGKVILSDIEEGLYVVYFEGAKVP